MIQIKFTSVMLLGIMVGACSWLVKDPSPEQEAYALYKAFVIFEEIGADIVTDSSVSTEIKRAIRDRDRQAKPVADSILLAILELQRLRTARASDEAVFAAELRLSQLVDTADAVTDFITFIEKLTSS